MHMHTMHSCKKVFDVIWFVDTYTIQDGKMVLSELGTYMLGTESIALPLLHLLLSGFSWPDSAALKKVYNKPPHFVEWVISFS